VSPRVLFEPIGEEVDCGEEESVLDAAFRHGFNLVYGCREGQCSACKAYLLEGEVVLKPYSTFALSESEETNGYTLLCRAMPEEDLVVERAGPHRVPDADGGVDVEDLALGEAGGAPDLLDPHLHGGRNRRPGLQLPHVREEHGAGVGLLQDAGDGGVHVVGRRGRDLDELRQVGDLVGGGISAVQ